jgi:predicted nucleic acid-binding protein
VAGIAGVFVDTSVLVAGTIEVGPSSAPAQRVLDAVATGRVREPVTAWHCCLEYFAVTTRLPEEFRLAPAVALQLLQSEIMARFRVQQLPEGRLKPFLVEAVGAGAKGGRIYDSHIAEVARHAGARCVVTDNLRDFGALERHGIRIVDSARFLEEDLGG